MKVVKGKILKRLSIVAMASLFLITAMSAMAVPTMGGVGFMLSVDPPYQEVSVCRIFVVRVNLSIPIDPLISGVFFNLTFDPNLMECISVTNTSFPPGIYAKILSFNNTEGWVIVRFDAEPGFDGTGTIAVITFHCKGEGTSFLNFTDYVIGAPANGPYEAILENGTIHQGPPPVGGEIFTIDSLALLVPWVAAAGAVAGAMALVVASRRRLNH